MEGVDTKECLRALSMTQSSCFPLLQICQSFACTVSYVSYHCTPAKDLAGTIPYASHSCKCLNSLEPDRSLCLYHLSQGLKLAGLQKAHLSNLPDGADWDTL